MTERLELAKARGQPLSLRCIARALQRAPSTLARELQRNSGSGGYEASVAHQRAAARRREAVRPRRLDDPELRRRVGQRLREKWSPEQIAGRDGGVSTQTIYTYIRRCRPAWGRYLRQHTMRARWGYRQPRKYPRIHHFKSIEDRPMLVDQRARVGDWESDTVRGADRHAGIATHVDRRTGYVVVAKLTDRSAGAFNAMTTAAFMRAAVPTHTFTVDHGMEFASFAGLEQVLHAQVYFAHARRAWERGCNENFNGLLRQYFPKTRDFGALREDHLQRVAAELNDRPRKRLGYRSPAELMREAVALQP